jgi:hypothetical protein
MACIKSRADALANLPSRARWFPQGDAASRQRNGSRDSQPSSVQPMEGFMSKKTEANVASDGGPEFTSAGVPWSEVPEFARADVAWIDGRQGSAQSSLPPVDVLPVPDILYRLPHLHEDRPRGSKAMLDAAGARARLRDVRPGAWLISPFSGQKWAKWPSGDVGWLPPDIELPATLQVGALNDR